MPAENLKLLAERLKNFDLEKEQNIIIEQHKDALANLQAEQWGSISKDYAGRDIRLLDNPGGNYRPFTIEKKKNEGIGLGAITSRITLFQTGELYRKLFVTITNGKFLFKSDVPYFSTLMKRTGDVTGLDKDKQYEFFEAFTRPEIKQKLKEQTGLSFN